MKKIVQLQKYFYPTKMELAIVRWKDEAQYPLTLPSCHTDRGWSEPSNSLGGSSHAVEWIFMNECARIPRSKALECAPCFHPCTYIYVSDSQFEVLVTHKT